MQEALLAARSAGPGGAPAQSATQRADAKTDALLVREKLRATTRAQREEIAALGAELGRLQSRNYAVLPAREG